MDAATPIAVFDDPANPPATTTAVVPSLVFTPMLPLASSVEPPITLAPSVPTTTFAEIAPPRANFSAPAPPRVTLTSTVSDLAPTSMVEPVEVSVDPLTCDVTVLKTRLTPMAAPRPALPLDTAIPPPRATLTSRSSAVSPMAVPAWILLPVMWASMVFANTLRAMAPASATFSDPDPPAASEPTTPVSLAVPLKLPVVVSVEPSIAVRTTFARTFTPTAAPRPTFLPYANAPAKE